MCREWGIVGQCSWCWDSCNATGALVCFANHTVRRMRSIRANDRKSPQAWHLMVLVVLSNILTLATPPVLQLWTLSHERELNWKWKMGDTGWTWHSNDSRTRHALDLAILTLTLSALMLVFLSHGDILILCPAHPCLSYLLLAETVNRPTSLVDGLASIQRLPTSLPTYLASETQPPRSNRASGAT
jgi:hypothetical protein